MPTFEDTSGGAPRIPANSPTSLVFWGLCDHVWPMGVKGYTSGLCSSASVNTQKPQQQLRRLSPRLWKLPPWRAGLKPQRQACHLRKHSRRSSSAFYLCQVCLPAICSHGASEAGEEPCCFSLKTTSLEGNTHPFSMYAFSLCILPTHLSFTLIIKKKNIWKKEKKILVPSRLFWCLASSSVLMLIQFHLACPERSFSFALIPVYWHVRSLVKTHRLPWWLSGKESACQCRTMGLIPDLGRSHVLRSNHARVPQRMSLWLRAWEPQLLGPCAAATEACVS